MSTVFFFFSSRRRHTRCLSDWSSDVCSSDLFTLVDTPILTAAIGERSGLFGTEYFDEGTAFLAQTGQLRSEERRVGKEWRSRWSQEHKKKKQRSDETSKPAHTRSEPSDTDT